MVVILFVVTVVVALLRLDSPALTQGALAVLGVTEPGLILWMFRLWREKLHTETLIAVAVNGDEAALRQLLVITQHVLLRGRRPEPLPQGGSPD
jgi:hypothetical protein